MTKLLSQLFEKLRLPITNIQADLECEDYWGYNFLAGSSKIKFRKAKITPKKTGQFVTFWQRNSEGVTEPFHLDDDFNFCIIYVAQGEKKGSFLFPKQILAAKQILTKGANVGKRGFRVYPDWDFPANKQAEKTKAWQTEFFIDLGNEDDLKRVARLIEN